MSALAATAFYTLRERKLLAYIQHRKGPSNEQKIRWPVVVVTDLRSRVRSGWRGVPDRRCPAAGRRSAAGAAAVPAVRSQLVDGHSALLAQLATQRVNSQSVHDGHDQQRNVERRHRGGDDERLRLRTTSCTHQTKTISHRH